jgi:hypothetical protein
MGEHMPDQEHSGTQVYQLSPSHMEVAIQEFLTPVIDRLATIRSGFAAAHGEVKAAHDNETPGWFGGEGHSDIRFAVSSFLNEVEYQLSELVEDQDQLVASLTNYREGLLGHIDWLRQTEANNVARFQKIARDLDDMGW